MKTNTRTTKITKATIVVSYHEECGSYYYDLRVDAVLPKCRKSRLLSFAQFRRVIGARPLFGHPGSTCMSPDDYTALIESCAVVSNTILPCEITSEIETAAREYHKGMATCPAVTSTNTKHVHPDYSPRYDAVVMEVV